MDTLNQALIRAPASRVYAAAERIVDWPRLLGHYRHVSVFEDSGPERRVEMAASRSGFPCRWQSLQRLDPRKKTVYYLHTRSFWTKGMEVWWRLERLKDGSTRVILTHHMPPSPCPPLNWFRQAVVGRLFVHAIADKTLAGLKRHLEAA